MATGHSTHAVGTLVVDVTFTVATSEDGHTSLVHTDSLYEPPEYTDNVWTTLTLTVEYLVFEGIDLPMINGAPFIGQMTTGTQTRDHEATKCPLYETAYEPETRRKRPTHNAIVRRRRVAHVAQTLVCCVKEDMWIGTDKPQLIDVDIAGCNKVPDTGIIDLKGR